MRALLLRGAWLCMVAATSPFSDGICQLRPTSARSAALGGSYTARARGYEAAFWNPANLGLPGGPGWSVGAAGARADVSNNSLSYGQITDLYGEFLDDATKSELLADVRAASAEETFELDFEVGGSVLGASWGPFAIGLATEAAGQASLSADALELLLFGNDGESGEGKDFDFAGSSGQVWWVSGARLAYGHRVRSTLGGDPLHLGMGAGAKYGISHGFLRFDDRGTQIRAEPLEINGRAERLHTRRGDAGRFWGIDLGVALQWRSWVASLAVDNVMRDFLWDREDVKLTVYWVDADFQSAVTTDSTRAFAELTPEEQRRLSELLESLDPPRRLRLGVSYPITTEISLSADYSELFGGRLRSLWDRSLAVGAEFRWLRQLPLRAGLGTDFSQASISAGAGLVLGVLQLDLAVGRWGLVNGDGVSVALTIGFWPSVAGSRFGSAESRADPGSLDRLAGQ